MSLLTAVAERMLVMRASALILCCDTCSRSDMVHTHDTCFDFEAVSAGRNCMYTKNFPALYKSVGISSLAFQLSEL